MAIDDEIWDDVRARYNYPGLEKPEILPIAEWGAKFSFLTNKITIDKELICKLAPYLPYKQAMEGVICHEVGHYMDFPRELSTLILAGKMLEDFFSEKPEENKQFIFQTYADLATDTKSAITSCRRVSILEIRKALQSVLEAEPKNPVSTANADVRALMLKYLHFQGGQKYELYSRLDEHFKKMQQIDFLDRGVNNMRISLFRWGEIVNEIVKDIPQPPDYFGRDIDLKSILKNATKNRIRKAIRDLSIKVSRGEYKKIKEWLKGKCISLDDDNKKQGREIGTSEGKIQVNWECVEYYKGLSRKYPLVLQKKPVITEKTRKSHSGVEKFRIGQDPLLAQLYTSGNKLLPGVTKKTRVQEKPIISREYGISHLMIAIDSSGSMHDPNETISYAVLGGHCAARSYHLHGAYIGVLNFSGKTFFHPYTRELDEALAAITAYQGGGTVVDTKMIKNMLAEWEELYRGLPERDLHKYLPKEAFRKEISISTDEMGTALEEKSIDAIMFTDGGIQNLEDVLRLMEERQSINRFTLVLTGNDFEYVPKSSKINIYHINNEEDIPNIIIRKCQGA